VFEKGRALFDRANLPLADKFGSENTQQIGVMLYGNYMFAFEIASLLLLVAILGAVIMTKKRI
jgi:NADH-quinone oxidoreductase subunit J